MKKIFFILILFIIIPLCASAQTEREILLEIVKQQATNNAKIDAMQKQMDVRFDAVDKRFEAVDKRFDDANKRVDILLYVMMGILGGLFGVIGFIVWDRQISMKPLLQENKDLAKEVKELKESQAREAKELRELKKEQIKTMNILKKIIEIEPRFAGTL